MQNPPNRQQSTAQAARKLHFPHFHPAPHHKIWWLYPFGFCTLLASTWFFNAIGAYADVNLEGWSPGLPWPVALAATLMLAFPPLWLRRRGAPMVIAALALAWGCGVIARYLPSLLESTGWLAMLPLTGLALLPVLLALPFARSLKHNKSDFRKAAIDRRKAIDPADRLPLTLKACERMLDLIRQNVLPESGFVAVYAASSSELSLEHLIIKLAEAGYRVAYPAILGDGLMEFYTTVGLPDLDLESIWLIAEPFVMKTEEQLQSLRHIQPEELSVMVVPGVAFDRDRFRMGFGGGFYDRYIPRLAESCLVAGICFDQQLYPSLPVESHDRRLAAVVSPSYMYLSDDLRVLTDREKHAQK